MIMGSKLLESIDELQINLSMLYGTDNKTHPNNNRVDKQDTKQGMLLQLITLKTSF